MVEYDMEDDPWLPVSQEIQKFIKEEFRKMIQQFKEKGE